MALTVGSFSCHMFDDTILGGGSLIDVGGGQDFFLVEEGDG